MSDSTAKCPHCGAAEHPLFGTTPADHIAYDCDTLGWSGKIVDRSDRCRHRRSIRRAWRLRAEIHRLKAAIAEAATALDQAYRERGPMAAFHVTADLLREAMGFEP